MTNRFRVTCIAMAGHPAGLQGPHLEHIVAIGGPGGPRGWTLSVKGVIERISSGVTHGTVAPSSLETADAVQVASVQTLGRRLRRWRDRFTLIAADEAQHAVAGSWTAILASQSRARVLGFTGGQAWPRCISTENIGRRPPSGPGGPLTASRPDGCFISASAHWG
jgi:hypothetical protein